jgi:hypothetical protein
LPAIKYQGFIYTVAMLYTLLSPSWEADDFLQNVVNVFNAYNLQKIKVI